MKNIKKYIKGKHIEILMKNAGKKGNEARSILGDLLYTETDVINSFEDYKEDVLKLIDELDDGRWNINAEELKARISGK